MGIIRSIIDNSFSGMRIHTGWYLIAFGMNMVVPGQGVLDSLVWAMFGRLYIIYWLIVHNEMYFPLINKLITLVKG